MGSTHLFQWLTPVRVGIVHGCVLLFICTDKITDVSCIREIHCRHQLLMLIPYSGFFSREKFFANHWFVRPNGNFGGEIFAVPLQQSHAYLTLATLSSSFRKQGQGRHE